MHYFNSTNRFTMIYWVERLFPLEIYTLFFKLNCKSLLVAILIQPSAKFFVDLMDGSYYIIYISF